MKSSRALGSLWKQIRSFWSFIRLNKGHQWNRLRVFLTLALPLIRLYQLSPWLIFSVLMAQSTHREYKEAEALPPHFSGTVFKFNELWWPESRDSKARLSFWVNESVQVDNICNHICTLLALPLTTGHQSAITHSHATAINTLAL